MRSLNIGEHGRMLIVISSKRHRTLLCNCDQNSTSALIYLKAHYNFSVFGEGFVMLKTLPLSFRCSDSMSLSMAYTYHDDTITGQNSLVNR